jgi:hypothetical protein
VLSALNTASSSLVNFLDTLNYLYCSRGTGLVKHSNALRITRGAIAVSDNGTGTIVGWCFGFDIPRNMRAKEDCLRKGGQNPKVVAKF